MGSVPNGNLTEVVTFGVYEVDPRAGELRRNGIKVKIQEQPYQVLSLLLERPGEVITREELKRRLWPADTFVDFDHSLNAAIKRLRDVLRDSADNPRFVETLARRGYRFLAPVTGSLPSGVSPALPVPHMAPRSRNRARWIAAIVVLAGACISVGFHIGNRAARAEVPREVRLTANSPDVPVYRAAISPDARLLAYTDPRGLFLREIAREDSHQLWLPPGLKPSVVSWFPDGSHLLVGGIQADETPSIWNVSILGGPSHKISDETDSGTVSPDGTRIAALRGNGKLNSSELWLMNADGSQPRKLLDIAGYSNSLTWSPSGTRLAYMKASYWPGYKEEVQIETIDLATGKTNTAFSDDRIGGGLVWSRDGRLFFGRVDQDSNIKSDIWSLRVDERTGEARGNIGRLTSGPDWKPRPEVSADGKQMVFLRNNIAPTVYLAQVDPKTKSLDQLERLTLDESVSRPYEWTPDGTALLYISNRDGEFHIFRQRLGAASPELLVDGHDNPNIMRLNPDGTRILYMSEASRAGRTGASPVEHTAGFDSEKVRVMSAPVSGGVGKFVLEADGMNNFQCARAPSTFCLFSRFTKDALAFVQFDSATGEMKDLFQTNDSGWQSYNWTLSPDGKLLALCKDARVSLDAEVRLIPTDGGAERKIHLNEWIGISAIDWAADGKSFWASATLRGETHALVNIDMHGDIKPVLQDGKPYVGWGIQSRDGKHLAIWQATGGSNVWMLEGF
ncbi:MAG TPA: winged helix-turn-helix domain-containing protein [Candidatus Eisenbacteria bacterium]|nr:winged helix-turn-helix domain-containing protein [Candidatus Eisenbacteria bacterium]